VAAVDVADDDIAAFDSDGDDFDDSHDSDDDVDNGGVGIDVLLQKLRDAEIAVATKKRARNHHRLHLLVGKYYYSIARHYENANNMYDAYTHSKKAVAALFAALRRRPSSGSCLSLWGMCIDQQLAIVAKITTSTGGGGSGGAGGGGGIRMLSPAEELDIGIGIFASFYCAYAIRHPDANLKPILNLLYAERPCAAEQARNILKYLSMMSIGQIQQDARKQLEMWSMLNGETFSLTMKIEESLSSDARQLWKSSGIDKDVSARYDVFLHAATFCSGGGSLLHFTPPPPPSLFDSGAGGGGGGGGVDVAAVFDFIGITPSTTIASASGGRAKSKSGSGGGGTAAAAAAAVSSTNPFASESATATAVDTTTATPAATRARAPSMLVTEQDPAAMFPGMVRIASVADGIVFVANGSSGSGGDSATTDAAVTGGGGSGGGGGGGAKVAVRQYKSVDGDVTDRSIAALRAVRGHPHITSFVKAVCWQNSIFIATQYCSGGPLSALLQHYTLVEDQVAFFTYQVVAALHYLHEHHRLHRRLCASHVLVDVDGTARITDLGLDFDTAINVATVGGDKDGGVGGDGSGGGRLNAAWRIAPELYAYHLPTDRSDIWSLGCLVVDMVGSGGDGGSGAGHTGGNTLTKVYNVCTGTPPRLGRGSDGPPLSKSLMEFSRQCFQTAPLKRPPAAELLKHKFIAGADSACNRHRLAQLCSGAFGQSALFSK